MTVTRINPVPKVWLDGKDITAGTADGTVLLLDGLTFTWGRDEVLTQPEPATGRLQLVDLVGTWATSDDFRGKRLDIAYYNPTSGVTLYLFRGRVGSPVKVSRRSGIVHPVSGKSITGTVVEFPLQSILVDLANRKPLVAWPAETIAARAARIAAAATDVLPGGVAVRNYWEPYMVAPVAAADQVSLWDHLQALYDSCGADRLSYLPDEQRTEQVMRPNTVNRGVAGLWWETDPTSPNGNRGAYLESFVRNAPDGDATPGVSAFLDAAVLEFDDSDGVTAPPRLSRVQVTYPNGATTAYTSTQLEKVVTGVDETVSGTRSAQLDVLLSDTAAAQLVLSDMEEMSRWEGSAWTLGGQVRYSTRRTGGFDLSGFAKQLLRGAETNTAFVLQRSWLPALGIRPVFTILGGTITYRSGGWEVELQLGPLYTPNKQHPISWSEIDDGSATYEVQWWDADHPRGLHETLTYEDISYCSTGMGYSVLPADSGWDELQK